MIEAAQKIRRGRKFAQVLDGAREIFLRDGFSGASVDDIARAAGVSKATLYSYFADKRLMFAEMARAECARQADEAEALIDPSAPLEAVLLEGARRFVELVTSDFSVRIFRICAAEADRFPELGRAFYESGPLLARARLGAFFREAMLRGDLAITDVDMAADQFAALCKAGAFERVAFGAGPPPGPAEVDRIARAAVATFLARYAVRG
ncbi:MAG: TetR/AcrR family transcriptional regulator [Gemmobacter sp.]